MLSRRLGEAVLVTATAAALSILLTYPLATGLNRIGRWDSDGRLSLWNVAWVARTLVLDPRHVYDANIFYPHRHALAFSESNLGSGALAIPVYWLTGNPHTAYNVVFLLTFVLSAVATYYLARYLTGNRRAAAIAAIAFTFCPYTFARLSHIQLLAKAGLPFSLLAWHRFVDRQTLARAVVLALVLAAQGLSCAYYGIFAGLAIGFAVIFYAISRRLWREWRYWLGTLAAAAVSIGLILPAFRPYLDVMHGGFVRSLSENQQFSADWRAYLASGAWAHRWILPLIGQWKEVLFPGFVATIFGAAGVWLGLKSPGVSAPGTQHPAPSTQHPAPRTPAPSTHGRETTVFYILLGALSFWASLGPQAGLYALFFRTIPVFSLLRAPARMGVMVALALSVLTAIAVDRLLRGRTIRSQNAVVTGLGLLMIVELAAIPLRLRDYPPVDPVYRVLASQPAGVVAEFPFFSNRPDFPVHTLYMRTSMYHWLPLVNGYSDVIPRDFRKIAKPLGGFPSSESFEVLARRRVRYVVLHLDLYDQRSRDSVLERLKHYTAYLRPLSQHRQVWLFEITGWPR